MGVYVCLRVWIYAYICNEVTELNKVYPGSISDLYNQFNEKRSRNSQEKVLNNVFQIIYPQLSNHKNIIISKF